jgi:hypothetical protein
MTGEQDHPPWPAALPPVVVFHEGADYWLADGFHRVCAAEQAGCLDVPCILKNGTQTDAQLFACGANLGHGLRRTNEDKRNAVRRCFELQPRWSDGKIANHCGVSQQFVSHLLKDARAKPGHNDCDLDMREGRDGKLYPARKSPPSALVQPLQSAKPQPTEAQEAAPPAVSAQQQEQFIDKPREARKDAIGQVIPACQKDVFGDPLLTVSVTELSDCQQLVEHIADELERKVQHYPFVHAKNAFDHLHEAAYALQCARESIAPGIPHVVCPKCTGTGCGECRKAGHLPEWRFTELKEQEGLT